VPWLLVFQAGKVTEITYTAYLQQQSEKGTAIHPVKSIFNSNILLILFYLIFIFIIELHIFIYQYFPLDKGN